MPRLPRIGRLAGASLGASALALPVAVIAAGAAPAPASAAAAATSGRSLPAKSTFVTSIRRAMVAARSVHFELTAVASGTHEHISADAGLHTGRQVITSGHSRATVVVTRTDAYFAGNATGLSTIFNMPSADVKKVGSKWVEVKAGTTQYTTFENGVVSSTLPTSFLPSTAETKSASLVARTLSGRRVYVLSWSVSTSGKTIDEALTVDASGRLPLSATGRSGKDHTTTTFSNWGEVVAPKVPSPLVSYTSLTG